ncbi:Pyridine nucleotide-disulfide oxidoreductase, FAD/NAD(P)-binding domain protein [Cordyceps fumosorosea ARSEF 2679]|uniref:Pyridine nucleotide-disulfide oxidoreductase, FAD/NAD(P)-binding domain protein n=1 Tax=Cordyceps fumosorosea (strain ARSEF 2679) TaxID=1081104 RepID=A0A162JH52_CORFA|nr:Pyridine nucleotide-disulfide oxidoreductase, FAD/NAD(P)-binding domain protein [Cordyceps fumosorosea ARSEF 2679]OAA68902.1 Pyridine nucleotide-disulfide oxidoreductase, FAD/NAD(P)-binding domain protein [Cordyceps fumosorosea ARSEF 2679]
MTGKTVVIVGGSIGGLGVAHRLLKHTLPRHEDLKVIIISQNSHFYWNIASVRAIIPDALEDEEVLQPIGPGLAQYNRPAHPSAAEFVLGTARSVDLAARLVHVDLAATDAAPLAVPYDHLVVATGSRAATPGMPWKAGGSHDALVASLREVSARVRVAADVVVAGGGATGVEVCGELRGAYPDKRVVLLAGGEALVGGDPVAAPALERALKGMGVDVRLGVRAVDTREIAGSGRTEVTLSDGTTLVTDLYLPTVGVTPNTECLPGALLDGRGYVRADEFMRVSGEDNVWAVGDVVGEKRSGFLMTEAQVFFQNPPNVLFRVPVGIQDPR